MEWLLEVFLDETDAINVNDWHNVIRILHQHVKIPFIILHECLMKHFEGTVKWHLNSNQLARVGRTSQEDGWSLGIALLLISLLIWALIQICLHFHFLLCHNESIIF
jgi:hypothetical protein